MRAIAWFAAFTAIQFAAWFIYYKADSDCPDPVRASCYPMLNTLLMLTVIVAAYGSVYVRVRIRRPATQVTGDDEPAIAAYNIDSNRRWSDPAYYWRCLALASLASPVIAALVWDSPRHRRTSVAFLLLWLGPALAIGAAELWRFLRAVTRDDVTARSPTPPQSGPLPPPGETDPPA